MARRTLVRESEAKGMAAIANDYAVLVSRCLSAVWKRRRVHWDRLSPDWMNPDSPHWHPAIQCLFYMPERRRIVAQVRRKLPQNRDFFASQDSAKCCDDLLTTTVDNADRAGL